MVGAAILLCGLAQSGANPIAVDGTRRPISMIAEQVDVAVRKGSSLVRGVYTFQQEKDDWPQEKDTHVTFYIPVLVGPKAQPDSSPRVVARGRSYAPHIRNDLSLGDYPDFTPRGLPHGWDMQVYECEIPLAALKNPFTVTVSYTQPHFPGNVAGYVPIKPPTKPGAGTITFRAEPGYSLKPFRSRFFFHPSYAKLDFVPENGELIRVQCVTLLKGASGH